MKTLIGCLTGFTMLMVVPVIGNATPELDQSNTQTDSIFASGRAYPEEYRQSFTVSQSGLLSEVDILMGALVVAGVPPTSASVDVLLASQASPQNYLFEQQVTVPVESAGPLFDPEYNTGLSWFAFDLSALDIAVSAGDSFWLTLAGTGEAFGISNNNPQQSGAWGGLCMTEWPSGWSCAPSVAGGAQMNFRTYINPIPVPEPLTICLLATALFELGIARRLPPQALLATSRP